MATPVYDRAYYSREPGVDDIRRFSTHWWAVRYYAMVSRRLLRRAGGRRFLDVGCAHGYTLARLEADFETFGIDLSPYAIERARAIAPRSWTAVHDVTDGFPTDLDGIAFDVVLVKYVFEHLRAPGETIRYVAGRLAPGGALFFSVPNTRSPGLRMKGPRWFANLDATHCSLLAPDEWIALAEGAGLVVERVWSDGLWDVPYVGRVPAPLQLAVFSLPAIAEILVGGRFLPVGWGENLLVVARRPASQRT